MTTQQQLTKVFNDNFVAYFRSHVAHANIVGRNFTSDHKLLGKVYEDLQSQIDIMAELLRSVGEMMPASIGEILDGTEITTDEISGTSEDLLGEVLVDLQQLKGCYEDLIRVATDDGHDEIANYAQDRVLALAKFIWMFESTLS